MGTDGDMGGEGMGGERKRGKGKGGEFKIFCVTFHCWFKMFPYFVRLFVCFVFFCFRVCEKG